MDPALATGTSTASVVFQDGLGERRRVTDATGTETLERLCLRAELTAIPSFEFALRERASRLAGFRHTYYARVRSVDRLNDAASTLAVVSESIRGVRLSTLLAKADRPTIDITRTARSAPSGSSSRPTRASSSSSTCSAPRSSSCTTRAIGTGASCASRCRRRRRDRCRASISGPT
ncbi:MAG: hypothetical protein DMG03_02955 [Acidobacteria bacterium]|nr:MAG: hypothetical protein DMG03_02955 [Acidobacteriota bacterium]